MLSAEILNDYNRLITDVGFVRLENWTTIRVTGKDRLKFLHNFCTAEIKALPESTTTEAFILDGKGKTIGHVLLFNGPDEMLMFGSGAQSELLMKHLDMYIICDDVHLKDLSREATLLFLHGPNAVEKSAAFSGRDDVTLVSKLEMAGVGQLLVCHSDAAARVVTELTDGGVHETHADALAAVRVEYGTPWFGIDLDDSNLPQELCRDEKAISFEKGCYLGQETVARIDSLGRVNKLICCVKFESDSAPDVGVDVTEGGKNVGRISSVVYSPKHESWIGLAILKRDFAEGKSPLAETKATVIL